MARHAHSREMSIVFTVLSALALSLLLSGCAGSTGSGGSSASIPVNQSVTYNSPSWWNGQDCNKSNFASAYDLLGYDNNGKPKTWRGIEACGPLPGLNSTGPIEDFHSYGAGKDQYMFQCTELIARYLWVAYSLPSPLSNGSGIVDAYTGLQNSPFHKVINNGTVQAFPVEGDVLSYDATAANGYFGHTSIVTASNMVSPGSGTITVLQQNMTWNGAPAPTDVLTISQWVIQPSAHGAGSVSSWMTKQPVSSQQPTSPPAVFMSGTWQDPYGGASYIGDSVTMKLTVQGNTLSGTLTGTTGRSTTVHGQDGSLSLFSSGDQQYLNYVIQIYGNGTGIFVAFTNDSDFEGAYAGCKYYGVVQQNGDIQGFWYFPSYPPTVVAGAVHMNKVS